jgi:cytoskeletal protein CcmA (bactofilin family)
VLASVKAREIIVLGTIHGNVETTDKIDIRKDAKLVGDIKTARVVIEDGAYFKGNIDIVRAEVPKPQPAPKPQPVASATAVSAATGTQVAAAGGGDLKR